MGTTTDFHSKIKYSSSGILILIFLFSVSTLKAEINSIGLLSFEAKEKTIPEVFDLIAAQTGYRFSYNPKLFEEKKKLTFTVENKNVEEVFSAILPSDIAYKQKGNHIILTSHIKESNPIHTPQTASVNTQPIKNIEKINESNYLINSVNLKKAEKSSSLNNGISNVVCHSCVNLKNEEEMKHYLAAILFAATSFTNEVLPQENTINNTNKEKTTKTYATPEIKENKPFQFSFVYPLGSDWINSADNSYNVSFNMIGGITGRTRAFELSPAFNMNKYSSTGFQLAGVFNISGYNFRYKEESNNVQIAGAFNFNRAGKSTQISGAVNISEKATTQISGAVNLSSESYTQIAGAVNSTKNGKAQIAGGVNTALESTVQIAGATNYSTKTKTQVAGGVNVAKESKIQIAGAANITGKGGFQLGVVNVRDTADGFSLGVVNIVKRGGVLEAGMEGGDFIHGAATLRSGVNNLYSIVSTGYNYSADLFTIGVGLGSSIRLSDLFRINLELMHYNLYNENFIREEYKGLVQFRPLLNVHVAKHFKVYGGPAFNLLIQNTEKISNYNLIDPLPGVIYDPYEAYIKAPYSILSNENSRTKLDFWIGFTAGIKF